MSSGKRGRHVLELAVACHSIGYHHTSELLESYSKSRKRDKNTRHRPRRRMPVRRLGTLDNTDREYWRSRISEQIAFALHQGWIIRTLCDKLPRRHFWPRLDWGKAATKWEGNALDHLCAVSFAFARRNGRPLPLANYGQSPHTQFLALWVLNKSHDLTQIGLTYSDCPVGCRAFSTPANHDC